MKKNVTIFLIFYFFSLMAIHFTVAHITKKESKNVLIALIEQKRFQGLALDDANFYSLATTMLESNDTLYVQKARFSFSLTSKNQEFVFADSGNFANRFHFQLKHDNYEIEMTIVNAYWSVWKQLFLAFVFSSVFLMALFLLRLKNEKEKYQIITQIAHDIQSPVVALEQLLSDVKNITEEDEEIIKKSLNRINNMASDLLVKNKLKTPFRNKNLNVEFLPRIVEAIVAEKRAQYFNRNNIYIDFKLNSESSALFSKIKALDFSRVVSNIINNAVDALNEKGQILITIEEDNENVIIKVSDNGKGISPETLTKLCQKGQTFGKEKGSGLGLFHAKKSIESWGGSIEISSTLSVRTDVKIILPKAPIPSWFVSKLELDKIKVIVILDDDLSIHHSWKKLFGEQKTSERQELQIHFFSTPQDLNNWFDINKEIQSQTLFLIDYELLGFSETGLDLIQKHKIQKESILVTSRFDDNYVFNKAIENHIRLIPKMILPKTQIHFTEETQSSFFEYIYLEDDEIHKRVWQKSAQKHNKSLLIIDEASDFFKYENRISKETTQIYLDSYLGDGKPKGEELAITLKEQGYKNLFLATGYEEDDFKHLPWLKVVKKKCPWVL